MTDGLLSRAKQPSTTTLCPNWFYGGPHAWNRNGRCQFCGITRTEARVLAKYRLQPALACEQHGHPKPEGWTVIPWPVPQEAQHVRRPRLAVDNSRKWPFPTSAHQEKR